MRSREKVTSLAKVFSNTRRVPCSKESREGTIIVHALTKAKKKSWGRWTLWCPIERKQKVNKESKCSTWCNWARLMSHKNLRTNKTQSLKTSMSATMRSPVQPSVLTNLVMENRWVEMYGSLAPIKVTAVNTTLSLKARAIDLVELIHKGSITYQSLRNSNLMLKSHKKELRLMMNSSFRAH